jgi:hypothetical protein
LKQHATKTTAGTRDWQKWLFCAPQTHLWLIKIWFFASSFVVKIATFAKPKTIITNFMKTLIIILTFLTFASFQSDNKSLLIGTWRQVGYKPHNSNDIKTTTESCANKIMTFTQDGKYEEEMYCLKSSGKWFINSDQTKFDFTLTIFNGMTIPAFSDTTKRTNKLIIRLTQDTLIYGVEAYYGNEKVYGHDGWYFVRQK